MRKFILLFIIAISFSVVNAQWVKDLSLISSNSLFNIKFADKNTGYAVGALGTIIKTVNGGTTWKEINYSKPIYLEGLFCVDSSKVYIAGEGILKTTNGGKNWSFTSIGEFNTLHSIYFIDSITGYAVGRDGLILKTNNNGTTWTKQAIETIHDLNSVYFINKDTGFAVGLDGIFKTTNGGNDWILSKTVPNTWLRSIYFTDEQTAYVSGDNGVIVKTVNGGADWFPLKSGFNYDLNSIVFPSPTTGYAFGDAGIILRTKNAGQLWTFYYGNGYADLYSTCFTDSITGFAVGGYGTILKTINGGGPEYNYNPLKDFTSNIHYVGCNYAMADFSFPVDTFYPGDTACWDFGDGSTGCSSYTTGAQHNYSKPGTFTVSLTFTRNGNSKTITKPNLITIRNAPQVDFDWNSSNQDSIFAPITIDFLNKTVKGDGDSLTYRWDFGDGSSSTEVNPSHTFTGAKTYSVALNVKDNLGCSVLGQKEIVVKDPAQRNEINYIVGSCSDNGIPPCGWDKHFIIENDTLKIYGFISGNCCTQKTATVTNGNDTTVIRTFEVGPQCNCICGYCFAINVPNINTDSVNVSFNGQLFTAKKTLSSIRFNPFINDIKIYPNPVKSDFTIDFSALNNINYQVEIFNMMGQMVYQDRKVTTSKLKVDASNLKSGFYLIKTFGDKSNVFMNKIIINKAQ